MNDLRPDELADTFVDFLASLQAPPGFFATDVLADFNVPHWRFQLRGLDELVAELEKDAPNGWKVGASRSVLTETGVVLEVEFDVPDDTGHSLYYRTMWLLDVTDGAISRITLYCTGEWDAETRARQAIEAPMYQP